MHYKFNDTFGDSYLSQLNDRFTQPTFGIRNSTQVRTTLKLVERSKRTKPRVIDTAPYKILDAPDLLDDYYLNLLDWSSTDLISIGLQENVYIYNNKTCNTETIEGGELVSSIKSNGNTLAIGYSSGKILVYDLMSLKEVSNLSYHKSRVGALCWSEQVIASGDKSGKVCKYDTRTGVPRMFIGHTQEVCGLVWSEDKNYLASGSNDNTVRIWKSGTNTSRCLKGHSSAVRALAWCPWRTGILASGGGTKDKTIKIWDVEEGKVERSVQTTSQICSLNYLPKYRELVSSHGYADNDIRLWKLPNMKLVTSFGKHKSRVLHVSLSPSSNSLASISTDNCLKFWKIQDEEYKQEKRDSLGFR